MKRKLVELTQEQCQEVIEKMAERSFYQSGTGKTHNAEELQTEESVESSIDDILPEPLPSVAKQAQTEAVTSVTEVVDEVPPTNVVEEQPPTPPIQCGRRLRRSILCVGLHLGAMASQVGIWSVRQ